MRTTITAVLVVCLGLAARVEAQDVAKPASNRATGENYHVEIGGLFWFPTPEVDITSEALGIIGSKIDFVSDLGIEKSTFKQLDVVLRPATKHKFRFEYTPITYTATATLKKTIIFNGIAYPISLPVASELKWKAYRFGYEYDFVYRDRGFAGLILEAKYTDIEATLRNAIDTEFVHAKAPVPAVGFIGRGYVAPNIAITGEFSFFPLPRDTFDRYKAKYYDLNIYGTVNFTNYVGAQVGYRSFDVFYHFDEDEGDLRLRGLYFGGAVRF
jgi:hypothetical protein